MKWNVLKIKPKRNRYNPVLRHRRWRLFFFFVCTISGGVSHCPPPPICQTRKKIESTEFCKNFPIPITQFWSILHPPLLQSFSSPATLCSCHLGSSGELQDPIGPSPFHPPAPLYLPSLRLTFAHRHAFQVRVGACDTFCREGKRAAQKKKTEQFYFLKCYFELLLQPIWRKKKMYRVFFLWESSTSFCTSLSFFLLH